MPLASGWWQPSRVPLWLILIPRTLGERGAGRGISPARRHRFTRWMPEPPRAARATAQLRGEKPLVTRARTSTAAQARPVRRRTPPKPTAGHAQAVWIAPDAGGAPQRRMRANDQPRRDVQRTRALPARQR